MTDRYRSKDPSTSELRHDWLCDRWVIIAPRRTDRPDDFAPTCDPMNFARGHQDKCPFCRGHENETPPPLAVYWASGPSNQQSHSHQPGQWLVRVVPNKFPAVCGVHTLKFAGVTSGADWNQILDGEPDECAQAAASKPGIDLFRAKHIVGSHEVIIESPLHLCSLTELDEQTAATIFRAYRDRLHHWSQCPEITYAVIFKNVGQDAGASLVHTHSQLIATNVLPPDIRRAIERMELYYETEHNCLFCRMLADELEENVRIVAETKDFVAFCPFASRLPSLVTVVPRQHQSSFEEMSDDCVEQLAWLVHSLVRSIEVCYPQAAYNYLVHTAPRGKRNSPAYHWRMEIFPRLTRVAGFEWGCDCFINPLPPEVAARRLRSQ